MQSLSENTSLQRYLPFQLITALPFIVYFQLNISEDDQSPFSIYQTEIGAFAIGDALTDDLLLALCRDHGDSYGSVVEV